MSGRGDASKVFARSNYKRAFIFFEALLMHFYSFYTDFFLYIFWFLILILKRKEYGGNCVFLLSPIWLIAKKFSGKYTPLVLINYKLSFTLVVKASIILINPLIICECDGYRDVPVDLRWRNKYSISSRLNRKVGLLFHHEKNGMPSNHTRTTQERASTDGHSIQVLKLK